MTEYERLRKKANQAKGGKAFRRALRECEEHLKARLADKK